MRPFVCSDNGQARTTTSAWARASSSDVLANGPELEAIERRTASTFMSKPAWHLRASWVPIFPIPTIATVLPDRSMHDDASWRAACQPAWRKVWSVSASFRAKFSIWPMAYSATEFELAFGAFATAIPAFEASATGIMSTPAPYRTKPNSFRACTGIDGGIDKRTSILRALAAPTDLDEIGRTAGVDK